MEEHLVIFETIDSIKNLIPEQTYIDLCNQAQNILKAIQKKEEDVESDYPEGYIIQELIDRGILGNDRIDSDEEEVPQNEVPCHCRRTLNDEDSQDGNLFSFLCLSSPGHIRECVNMNILCEKFPLLKNLYERQNIPFVTTPVIGEYNKEEFTSNCRILLNMMGKLQGEKNKSIAIFTIFSYIFENFQMVIDSPEFRDVIRNRLEEILDSEIFNLTAIEFNVDYGSWKRAIDDLYN